MVKVIFALLLGMTSAYSFAKTVIPVITENSYFPYSYQEGEELRGLYVSMAHELNELMPDFEIKLVPMNWKAGLNAIKKGKYPAILGAYYHGHDWEYLYPYSQPVFYEEVILICHPETDFKGGEKWPADFAGKLVSNVSGYDGWLNNNVRDKSVTKIVNFIEVPNISTAWNMVNKNLVDCSLFEKRALEVQLEKDPNGKQLIVATSVTVESVHIGYATVQNVTTEWPQLTAFQKQIDNALYQYKKDKAVLKELFNSSR